MGILVSELISTLKHEVIWYKLQSRENANLKILLLVWTIFVRISIL